MADNQPEQPAAETTTDPATSHPGPQVPKARTGEPVPAPGSESGSESESESVEGQPAPRKRAKRATKKTGKAAARSGKPARPESSPAAIPAAPHQPPDAWLGAFWEACSQPDQAPDRLLRMAVQEVGPRAAGWLAWVHQTYPDAPTSGIARLATHDATRTGRVVAIAGFGGIGAAPFTIPAALLVRVNLVLRIAAAYGHDPLHQQRVDDLVELLGLAPAEPPDWLSDLLDRSGNAPDPSEPGAENSGSGDLASGDPGAGAASETSARTAVAGRIGGILKRVDALGLTVGRLRLTRRSAPLLGVHVLLRLTDKAEEVERLAHRAIRFYRPGSSSSTDSSAPST